MIMKIEDVNYGGEVVLSHEAATFLLELALLREGRYSLSDMRRVIPVKVGLDDMQMHKLLQRIAGDDLAGGF
jgi:hypothetical protein